MRVLWFTHLPLDVVNRHFGRPTKGTGFWIHSLVEPLLQSGEVELGIVTATAGDPEVQFSEGGVDYFNIPQSKIANAYDLFWRTRTNRYLRRAAKIVELWKPDVIHVHGTERFFALVRSRRLTEVPTVVSVQGLMEPYSQWTFGELTWRQILANTTAWEISRNATLPVEHLRRIRQQVPMEREIIRGVDAMIGRTEWDHAHVRAANPQIRYFHVDEMMRPEFWAAEPWRPESVRRGSLITTLSPSPLKGVPTLLRAVATLRSWGHDVNVIIAGMTPDRNRRSYSGHVAKLVECLGLGGRVEFLGWCDAESLVPRLRKAHCFVSPSLIENSSNALCEAQLVGIPCVASHTGGTPTIVEDQKSGLLFSRADSVMLARQVERLMGADELALRLGREGRKIARERHEPGKIVTDLLNCYRAVAEMKVGKALQAKPAMSP